jgi:hypothetical protein
MGEGKRLLPHLTAAFAAASQCCRRLPAYGVICLLLAPLASRACTLPPSAASCRLLLPGAHLLPAVPACKQHLQYQSSTSCCLPACLPTSLPCSSL